MCAEYISSVQACIMETKMLSCPLCLKPHFEGVDALRATLIAAATSQIPCPVCNETLMGLDKLTIHLFSHITSNIIANSLKAVESVVVEKCDDIRTNTIRCDICNFSFSDENILEMHQKLLHQTLADKETGIYSYHCHLCSKKFKMRGSLMVHLRVAHYGFVNHNETKTVGEEKVRDDQKAGKQWACDVCSKMFTTKYFLKKHKRLHTGEMPYFCVQCNKYFTFQQSYHKHMLYHSSEKPHVCTECGRAFKELSTLHNHERIHSGERPFACETCGKCFRQRVSYLVHRRIHTGVMPYKCTACEKTFRYKVSQRSHKCPANPPGSVVRTSTPEAQLNAKATESTKTVQPTAVSSSPDKPINGFIAPNTIIVNSEGHIIGQNFSFDGNSIITYPNVRSCETISAPLIVQDLKEVEQPLGSPPVVFSNENNNPDFFTMVMSPTLPDVESLCLTSPIPTHTKDDDKPTLHTINEDSFKQLLYGEDNSPG